MNLLFKRKNYFFSILPNMISFNFLQIVIRILQGLETISFTLLIPLRNTLLHSTIDSSESPH